MMEPSIYDYLGYQTEDFVMDNAFQQWVLQPDSISNQFWQQFLQSFPDKQEHIEEAREMVSNILYQPHSLSKEKQERMLQKVYAHAEKSSVESKKITFIPFNKKYIAVAATTTILILSAVFFWLSFPTNDTYTTRHKENKTILLADGSEVSLNANTKLRVKIDIGANEPREVWLEGEAYFHVKRMVEQEIEGIPELKNFIVHTDNFDIEVLGTTFNASSRSRKSKVLLTSGKIKVASQQIEQTQILQPGDLLTLSEEDSNFHLKKTETGPEWRENFFFFENTPLSEVARAIEDYYGLKVKIADPSLLDKIFTARISRDELPMLLKAIEASFDVKVSNERGTISIQP